MILTDREIQGSLRAGQIEITPEPPANAYSSTSVDLTLDEPAELWKELKGQPIRPFAEGYRYADLKGRRTSVQLSNYTFAPQQFLLAWTKELVHLHNTSRLAARVEGKSGLARLGIAIHLTAPTIHGGFKGQIQLEMYNFSKNDIILDAGMPICQLIFEMTFGAASKGYDGIFAGQTAP